MEDLASTYYEDAEVYSNPDIDFAAELQYLHEKIIKCEENLKEQKKLTAKWEASSTQNHALVVQLSDKNAQNENILKYLLEEKDKFSKQKEVFEKDMHAKLSESSDKLIIQKREYNELQNKLNAVLEEK